MEPLIKELSSTNNLILLFVVCCVASYAVTEIVKPITKHVLKTPAMHKSAIKLVSCVLGAFVGYELSSQSLGLWIGFGCGALNTVVVAKLKNKIKGADVPSIPQEEQKPSSEKKD